MKRYKVLIAILIPFFLNLPAHSQTDDDNATTVNIKGFHAGLFVGTYFANQYTAKLYDGYGYDINGHRNDFANSFMYRKIVFEYGGANGQPDRIATALNVNHDDWSFSEGDMPVNLRYNLAFVLGAHMRYCFNNNNALVLNVNASKLSLTGNFTISLSQQYISAQPPGFQAFKTFSIIGGEQRLFFQLGYQHIIGDAEAPLNVFIEGGPTVSMVKFEKNQIQINSLQISLPIYYDLNGYVVYSARNLTGVAIGAFAGLGLNLNMSPQWTLQLLYNPSYDKVNIGDDPKLKLQHGLGLRAYYNL